MTDLLKVAIFNKKGGVGKTPLSYLIAKELGLKIITNDDNVINENMVSFQEKLDLTGEGSVVVDMGGWIDDNTADILEECDVVLVPFNNKPNSIKRTKNLTEELKELGIEYNLVFTQYSHDKEIDLMQLEFDNNVKYFLRNTKMLDIMIEKDMNIDECLSNPIYYNWFKNHAKQLKEFVADFKGLQR